MERFGVYMASKRKNKKKSIMEQKRVEGVAAGNAITANTTVANTSVEAPKKKEVEKNLYLQYNNLEFSDKVLYEAAIQDYCEKSGASQEEVQSITLYVKPEEGKAYYVMNEDGEKNGSIDL